MLAHWKAVTLTIGPFVPLLIGYFAYTTLGSRNKLSSSGFDISRLSQAQINAIYQQLPDDVVSIARDAVTEPRHSASVYEDSVIDGVFVSVVTGLPLFDSKAKFESGSGWPSFYEPFDKDHVLEIADNSNNMNRIEVLEARGNTHLGHVFNDDRTPTNLRYCMNGAVLDFIPRQEFNTLYPNYHKSEL